MNLKTQLLTVLIAFTFLITSCKKEIDVDLTDNKFPINLTLVEKDGVSYLTWDKVKVSNFVSYILVRSTKPIAAGLEPKVGDPDNVIITEITDIDSTEFSDLSVPWNDVVYYKLYVDIGYRFIESQSLENKQSSFVFKDFFETIKIDNDSNWAILIGSNFSRVVVFDLIHNEIISDNTLNIFVDPNTAVLETGHDGTNKMLYLWDDFSASLNKYTLPDLELLDQEYIPAQFFSLLDNGKGKLYSTSYDQTNSFGIRNQNDLKLIKGVNRSNYYDQRSLVILDPTIQKVAEISSGKIISFDVNQGNYVISNQTSVNISGNSQSVPREIVISKDRNYMVVSTNGTVYDKDLKLVAKNAFQSDSQYAFSEDSKFFYRSYRDNNNIVRIAKYSFPDMQLLKEIELPLFSIVKMQQFENSLLVFGLDPLDGTLLYKRIEF